MFSEFSHQAFKIRRKDPKRLHTDPQLIEEVLDQRSVEDYLSQLEMQWEIQSLHWTHNEKSVALYPEVLELTLRAAYNWAGIPYSSRGFPFRVNRYHDILHERSSSRLKQLKGAWSRWREERKLRNWVRKIQKSHGHPKGPAEEFALLIGLDGQYFDSARLAPVLMDFFKSLAEVAIFVPFAAQTIRVDSEFRHDITWDLGHGNPRHEMVSGSMNLAVKYLTERLRYEVSKCSSAPEKLAFRNVERRIYSLGFQ